MLSPVASHIANKNDLEALAASLLFGCDDYPRNVIGHLDPPLKLFDLVFQFFRNLHNYH